MQHEPEMELEGIFGGMDYDTGSFVLFYPAMVTNSNEDSERKIPLGEKKRTFYKGETDRITFQNAVLAHTAPMKTNQKSETKDKSLQRFFDGVGGKEIDLDVDEEWDQFAENEKRFNVKTTFDEEEYTTKLDLSSLTSHQKAKAEQISREIERAPTSNFHMKEDRGQFVAQNSNDVDEEKLYSAVIGTGKYTNTEKTEISPAVKPPLIPPAEAKPRIPQYRRLEKPSHRNSLDCIGVDSGCMMDPEVHHEMMKYKHQKLTMRTVEHMKSLSPSKRNGRLDKPINEPISSFCDENKSVEGEDDSLSCSSSPPVSELSSPKTIRQEQTSISKPKATVASPPKQICPLEIKVLAAKYNKSLAREYKAQYKRTAMLIRGGGVDWNIAFDISVYAHGYLYGAPMTVPIGNYYMGSYYPTYAPQQYMGTYYPGYQYYHHGNYGYGYTPQ